MNYPGLNDLIKRALEEDIGYGDITTQSLIPAHQMSKGTFVAKVPGVVAGTKISQEVFSCLDPDIDFQILKKDGVSLQAGDIIAEVQGLTWALLTGERTALKLMQKTNRHLPQKPGKLRS